MDDATPNPADIPAPGSYHWTPKLQREFLENLATTGSVKIACASVGMSGRAAYDLRHKPQGAAFRLGWAAAVLIARQRLTDELLDRAIWGHEETTTIMREEDRRFVKRQRADARLGLAMLARLDRMVEIRADAGEDLLAQLIAGDWGGFLALFDVAEAARGGADGAQGGAEDAPHGLAAALALWLAGRDDRTNPLAALGRDNAITNEVSQISADFGEDGENPETPEEAAAAMTVWFDNRADDWRTDFPPPDDFYGYEEGQFGDPAYVRELEDDELALYGALRDAEVTPLRIAGEAARRAFFGLPAPANDPAPAGEATRGAAEKARKIAGG